jgi:hypothetical protein
MGASSRGSPNRRAGGREQPFTPGEPTATAFQARQGQSLVIAASARELMPYLADAVPGWFQAVLTLYDAAGKEVAYDDDFRFHPDPVLHYVAPTGWRIHRRDHATRCIAAARISSTASPSANCPS